MKRDWQIDSYGSLTGRVELDNIPLTVKGFEFGN